MQMTQLSTRAVLLVSMVFGFSACDDDSKRKVPGDTLAVTSDNRLVSFKLSEPQVGSGVTIGNLQAGEKVIGIDRRPADGHLYAVGDSGRVYTIDESTGVATLKALLAADTTDLSAPFTALSGDSFGIDFNPVVDRLRIVSDSGQNLRVNVDNGATITDAALTVAAAAVNGVTATAYSNAFASACRTTHYFIDTSADRLLSAVSSNDGTLAVIGALGVDADQVNGFDVLTVADGSNSLLASLTVAGVVKLYSLNPGTGVATEAGTVQGLNANETLRGLALNTLVTAPSQAPGELLALSEDDQLLSFNANAPQKPCTSGVAIASLPAGEILQGFDLRPNTGEYIALSSGSSSRLYAIDVVTGALTLKSTLSTALAGTAFGVDFNPAVDRLRVVSDTGQNLRINVDTGAVTSDTALTGDAAGAVAAAYTNSIGGLSAAAPGILSTELYVIDSATDKLYLQSPPNTGVLTARGALGVDIATVAGFDINARSGVAVAALNVGTATSSDLYTINLQTGVATRVNTIGGGKKIKGLSYRVNSKADLIALTTDNRLSYVNATSAPVAISGLPGGETLVGLDYRPATSDIVALSDQGKLYKLTFDGSAASATALSTLSVGLTGTAFGLDFNPVPDRLRVVSDAEQNLRINVATGAVLSDGALTPAGTLFAAAYTQNFAGATTTRLYYIDAASDRLLTTADPNSGVLTDVGPLGVDVDAEGDLDIVGGQDGIVFAALQPTGSSASKLYRIDLSSGAASEVSAIGTGSFVVRGLTTRLQ